MSKKYIGKMKSFKELMCVADDVDDEGDLLFYKSIDTGIYFENSKKELCGTEILLLKSENVNFDYINSNQKQYYKKEWFSEIKEIER